MKIFLSYPCSSHQYTHCAIHHAPTHAPPNQPTTQQIFFQAKYLIPDPIANDVKYQAAAQPFLVFGLLTTALAIGHVNHMG